MRASGRIAILKPSGCLLLLISSGTGRRPPAPSPLGEQGWGEGEIPMDKRILFFALAAALLLVLSACGQGGSQGYVLYQAIG